MTPASIDFSFYFTFFSQTISTESLAFELTSTEGHRCDLTTARTAHILCSLHE